MLENITSKIMTACVEEGYISKDEESQCEYKLLCKIEGTVFLASVILIGLITHEMGKLIIFTFAYRLLRRHSGGYHLANYIHCYFISIIITTLCIIIPVVPMSLALIVLGISTVIILIVAPVNHPNYNGTNDEMYRHKILMVLELFALNTFYIVCFIRGY